MMKVIKLTWLSKAAKEAELVISDGIYRCLAFCHPCEISEGDVLKEPLHAFILKGLMLSNEMFCSINTIKLGELAHKCVAEAVDIEQGLVRVGNINILLDEQLPPGLTEGDFVEFTCMRLDIW